MIIKNGNIYTNKLFINGDIIIQDKIIKHIVYNYDIDNNKINESDEAIIDASDLYIIPGLVDIHFHGCKGHDFCEATFECLDMITQYQMQNGVTSIIPATMTLSRHELEEIFINFYKYKNDKGSTIRGITMEGPFVSQSKKGAQNGNYILMPDIGLFREMQKLSGNMIKQVAVAPEEDKDFLFVKEVSKETVVSVAHTMADYDIADNAFKSGATHVTHLFNAMPAFNHREPSIVGAAFDNPNVFVELICDGIHLHPSIVRAMFKMFGADRICMISDSMMATGMPDGDYMLGGQSVKVSGKKALLKDGTIAGSVSNLYDCLKTAVFDMKIPLAEAICACTSTPAKSLGIENECGYICVGKEADLVLMDKDLNIRYVIKSGEIVI